MNNIKHQTLQVHPLNVRSNLVFGRDSTDPAITTRYQNVPSYGVQKHLNQNSQRREEDYLVIIYSYNTKS